MRKDDKIDSARERKIKIALKKRRRARRREEAKRALRLLAEAIRNPIQALRRIRKHVASSSLGEAARIGWAQSSQYVRLRLIGAVVLTVVTTVITALAPVAFKIAVDGMASPQIKQLLIMVPLVITAYILTHFVGRVLTALRVLFHGYGLQRLQRLLSLHLFSHIVRLPLRFHLSRKTGAAGEILNQGLDGYNRLVNHTLYSILPVFVEFTTILIVLVMLKHSTYLIIFFIAGVAYYIAYRNGATNIIGPAREASAAQVESQSVLAESLQNNEIVKYFSAEDAVCDQYDRSLQKTESAWGLFNRRLMVNTFIVGSIFTASLGTSLILAYLEVKHGKMSVGDFVLLNTYVLRFTMPLEMLGNAFRDLAQGLAFLRLMLELLREKREADSEQHADTTEKIRGEIQFKNVTLSYEPGHPILRNVSFTAHAGKKIAIVGASGSGKSSIIRLLYRLWDVDEGTIRLDGQPIDRIPLSRLRQAIAIVPQDLVLYHDTIRFNIAFGKWGASNEEIMAAAKLAQVHSSIVGRPQGYNALVGARGLQLSGGERQRIAIARAIIKRPRILVFDEATSSLDSKTESDIIGNMLSILDTADGVTLVMIAHRLSTVMRADQILVMDKGTIVERGTHDELCAKQGVYAGMWRAQHPTGAARVARL